MQKMIIKLRNLEDDWQIEMPDGDGIDDIEEACVDEDSPHLQK